MSKTTEVRHQVFTAPVVAGTDDILSTVVLPTADTLEVTDFDAQPDNIRTIALTGNAVTVTGDAIVEGTDAANKPISETVALNGTATVETLGAFKSLTKVTVPARGAADDAVSIGNGASLGYDCLLDADSLVLNPDAVTSDTRDNAVLTNNVFVPSATLNGTDDVVVAYIPFDFPQYDRVWG